MIKNFKQRSFNTGEGVILEQKSRVYEKINNTYNIYSAGNSLIKCSITFCVTLLKKTSLAPDRLNKERSLDRNCQGSAQL